MLDNQKSETTVLFLQSDPRLAGAMAHPLLALFLVVVSLFLLSCQCWRSRYGVWLLGRRAVGCFGYFFLMQLILMPPVHMLQSIIIHPCYVCCFEMIRLMECCGGYQKLLSWGLIVSLVVLFVCFPVLLPGLLVVAAACPRCSLLSADLWCLVPSGFYAYLVCFGLLHCSPRFFLLLVIPEASSYGPNLRQLV
ncbi:hypothetical protein U1Q18_008326 [Sarracenia purpurea var. burkii]